MDRGGSPTSHRDTDVPSGFFQNFNRLQRTALLHLGRGCPTFLIRLHPHQCGSMANHSVNQQVETVADAIWPSGMDVAHKAPLTGSIMAFRKIKWRHAS